MNKAFAVCLSIVFSLFTALSFAAEDPAKEALQSPIAALRGELLSYFTPLTVNVAGDGGAGLVLDKGSADALKKGMRLKAYREGVPFIHPVTKERLGNVEMAVGTVEVSETAAASSKGVVVEGKPEDFNGAKAKNAATKVKLLFYQGAMDWYLGDAYFRSLQESGRFELIDTPLETSDTAALVAEAKKKGAEVLLILNASESRDAVELRQRLFWVSDGKGFSDAVTAINPAVVKQLKYSSGLFAPKEGEILLSYKLPFSALRISMGDFDGNKAGTIALASESRVAVYRTDVDLKLLWEFEAPDKGEIIWLDTVDANRNGKDEIVITTMRSSGGVQVPDDRAVTPARDATVTSYVYELQGTAFVQTWKAEGFFLRKVEGGIIAQAYSRSEGFEGDVLTVEYRNGSYAVGGKFGLPKGTNIYDFQFAFAPDGRKALFAWDENGFLNLYSEKGIRLWVSKEDIGGSTPTFKKDSSTVMIDRGKWSLKHRLLSNNAEVLAPKRKPVVGMVKGLGYSGSEIMSYWWNGISVEERQFVGELGGDVLDYALVGDRFMLIVKPFVMNQAKLILKGQSPFGTMLYIYSTKGR